MSILTTLLKTVLEFLWGKLYGWWKERSALKKEEKVIEEENSVIREKLEKAETPEEREAAADEIFKRFDK